MQNAFNKMRLLMAADALAAYLNHNKWFDAYTCSPRSKSLSLNTE